MKQVKLPQASYWTILREAEPGLIGKKKAKCRRLYVKCKCGKEKVVAISNLRGGRSLSCGCKPYELKSHNLSRNPLYMKWYRMKKPSAWKNFQEFYAWAAPLSLPGLELTRKDKTKDWSPNNCVFLTRQELMQKIRGHSEEKIKMVKALAKELTQLEIAKRTGLSTSSVNLIINDKLGARKKSERKVPYRYKDKK